MLKLNDVPKMGTFDNVEENDIVITARLFALGSAAVWLIAEYNPETKIAFGYADLNGIGREGGAEWGYISIEELESLKYSIIPQVERDKFFSPQPFKKCLSPEGRV